MLTIKKTILFTEALDAATREAAEQRGMQQSEWIREACLARLSRQQAKDIRGGFTPPGRPPKE